MDDTRIYLNVVSIPGIPKWRKHSFSIEFVIQIAQKDKWYDE